MVYSPHTYGPSVYDQPQFSERGFPRNLGAIWDRQWGLVAKEGLAPVVVGEWGGRFHMEVLYLPCTFPVPSLYLPCTFPVPS